MIGQTAAESLHRVDLIGDPPKYFWRFGSQMLRVVVLLECDALYNISCFPSCYPMISMQKKPCGRSWHSRCWFYFFHFLNSGKCSFSAISPKHHWLFGLLESPPVSKHPWNHRNNVRFLVSILGKNFAFEVPNYQCLWFFFLITSHQRVSAPLQFPNVNP